MNMRKNAGWLCALLLVLLSSTAQASMVSAITAVVGAGGGSTRGGVGDGPWNIGTRFTVGSTPLVLNTLGVQDVISGQFNVLTGDGILVPTNHYPAVPVALWTQPTMGSPVLLAATGITTANTLSGGYRYSSFLVDANQIPLGSPVTLSANTTYLVAAMVGAFFNAGNLSEPFGEAGANDSFIPTNPSLLTLLESSYDYASGFAFFAPTTAVGYNQWGPANLQVTPVPEPSSLVMLLVGGAFMGLFRRLRSR